jgi:hypothetical protein
MPVVRVMQARSEEVSPAAQMGVLPRTRPTNGFGLADVSVLSRNVFRLRIDTG